MAYDHDPSNSDIAALKARQAGLRAFVENMADHVMSLSLPGTFLEAERSVRAITVADRFLKRVPPSAPCEAGGGTIERSEEGGRVLSDEDAPSAADTDDETAVSPVRDPHRLRLRVYADRVMKAATLITKPASFLEAERAGRYAENADRMLVQLYTPPKAGKPAVDDRDHDRDDDCDRADTTGDLPDLHRDFEAYKARLLEKLLTLARRKRAAREAAATRGIYASAPDAYDPLFEDHAAPAILEPLAEPPPDAPPPPQPPPRQSVFAPCGIRTFPDPPPRGISDPRSDWNHRFRIDS